MNGRRNSFFKSLEQKVKAEGFAIVDVQMGQFKRPEVMPLVDDKPVPIEQLETIGGKRPVSARQSLMR